MVGCNYFSGLFVCHLIPHYPQWLAHQVKDIWCRSSRWAARKLTMSSALLLGTAIWRFAIRSRTDWLSLIIRTFFCDSFLWIICNAFWLPSLRLVRTSTMYRPVWHTNGEMHDDSGGRRKPRCLLRVSPYPSSLLLLFARIINRQVDVSLLRSAQSMTILLSVWSASM